MEAVHYTRGAIDPITGPVVPARLEDTALPMERRIVFRSALDKGLIVWARSRAEATIEARRRGYTVMAVTDYREETA